MSAGRKGKASERLGTEAGSTFRLEGEDILHQKLHKVSSEEQRRKPIPGGRKEGRREERVRGSSRGGRSMKLMKLKLRAPHLQRPFSKFLGEARGNCLKSVKVENMSYIGLSEKSWRIFSMFFVCKSAS